MFIEQIMKHIRNYFYTDKAREGEFTISNGTISLDFAVNGNYIKIEGSLFNDGVYQYPLSNLTDETFTGRIVVLAPDKEFLEVCGDIELYVSNNPMTSAFLQSESFGGYSYSRATTSAGTLADWKDVFRSRLNTWRKV